MPSFIGKSTTEKTVSVKYRTEIYSFTKHEVIRALIQSVVRAGMFPPDVALDVRTDIAELDLAGAEYYLTILVGDDNATAD